MASIEEITSTWWEVQRLFSDKPPGYYAKSDELWWAWDEVSNVMSGGSPRAVDLLLALCDSAPRPEDLATVGAGPLEDLIVDHGRSMGTPEGAELLSALSAASRQNRAFRAALENVWYESQDVPDSVRQSIPGMPLPMDEWPRPATEPKEPRSRKHRSPGRPPPTRRLPS